MFVTIATTLPGDLRNGLSMTNKLATAAISDTKMPRTVCPALSVYPTVVYANNT